MQPTVSVIIPNWDRKDDILRTLEGLRRQDEPGIEVIVVDQASTDGGPEEIERRFPEVVLIRLPKNVGPGAARNLGAERSRGRILVFLDNDDDLDPSAVRLAARRFEGEKDLGLVGFKILNAHTRELEPMSWSYQKSRLKDADTEFETYIFCGGGYAMPRKVFEEGARYWDGIFWLAEEADLALRIMKMGYRILYCPDIKVYHRASPERRPVPGKRHAQGFRNYLWIMWRYYPLGPALGTTFLRTAVYLFKGLRGGYFWDILGAFVSAWSRAGILFSTPDRLDKASWERYKKLSHKGPAAAVLGQVWRNEGGF